MILDKYNYEYPKDENVKLYIVTIGTSSRDFALKMLYELRKKNIKSETDYLNRSVKAQMKEANKINAKYVIVIGDDELTNQKAKLKNMSDGIEKEIELNQISDFEFFNTLP